MYRVATTTVDQWQTLQLDFSHRRKKSF